MDYFINRRTIRKYTTQQVSDELLNDLLLKASHAPTTGNMQLYSVIVTRSDEMKKKLAPCHFNQPQADNCSVLLTFCADYNRFTKWCKQRDANPGYDNLQSLVTAAIDTIAFAQQFVTAAEMQGLGCCYLGTTTYNAPDIAKILGLPTRVVPIVTISVGYPDGDGREDGRLPLQAIVHSEQYHDYTPTDIDNLYAEKEARADSKQYVAENDKKTLAQVFTDVRYTRQANEHFSEVLKEYLTNAYPGLTH